VWSALAVAVLLADDPSPAAAEVEKGDAAYARRDEGAHGETADPRRIEEALGHYRAALRLDPASRRARARLMRAAFFRAAFCGASRDERLARLEEARRRGEEAIRALEVPGEAAPARLVRLRATPQAIDLYFWSAAAWGEWALARGKLAAAREGAGPRIRDLAATVRDLDAAYEQGGGDRILGRLHDQSPKIPLITGWVSRRAAIDHLRRALALGPDNSVNKLFLAEALLEHVDGSQAEARSLLEACAGAPPRPEYRVEDTYFAARARELLDALARGR
jgi:tetratricopeptide (TPR) repeat protein